MRIIDCNAMLGIWGPQKLAFSTAAELLDKMNHYGIAEAYAHSSYAVRHNPIEGNYMLANQIKGFEDRIKPCWVVLPTWDIEAEKPLESELKAHGVRMVRMAPTDHTYAMDSWVCGDLYAMLEKNRIILTVNHPDVSLGQLHSIAGEFPELPIILTQCDYPQNRTLYKLLEKHPNIYLEIATYYVYDGMEDIARRFGAERMVFGSRMPFLEAGASLGMTMLANLTTADQEKILAGNMDRLLQEVRI